MRVNSILAGKVKRIMGLFKHAISSSVRGGKVKSAAKHLSANKVIIF
jgi:hypothetical protein